MTLQISGVKFKFNEIGPFIKLYNAYKKNYSLININIMGNAKENTSFLRLIIMEIYFYVKK